MQSKFKEPRFGFWFPIVGRESAKYAVKMSGLPIFLMGIILIIQGFMGFQVAPKSFAAAMALLSLMLGWGLIWH